MITRVRRATDGDPTEAVVRTRMFLLLAADALLLLALAWLAVQTRDLGYRLENTAKLIERLDLEYAELVAETARETSPERLRVLAETELGLRVPEPGQVLIVDAQP